MFDAGFFGVREDAFPINGSLTHVSEAPANFHRGAGSPLLSVRVVRILDPVFYMNEREATGMFVEIGDGVFAGDIDPTEIQFHSDEPGIRFGEEEIVREFAAERFGGIKLEGVIVVAELDAGFFAGFAGFIEKFGGALPSAGFGALFLVNPGADDVAVADDMGRFESFGPPLFDDIVAGVAGRRSQAVLVEDGADFFRRTSEVSAFGFKNTGE